MSATQPTVRGTDKRMAADDVAARLASGMTIGIGGWGSRRKPMELVKAICRSDLRDLTVVSYGGPDVGLLCATGKVRKVVYAFVSLDSIALEPHFRAARESGSIEVMELDEGMFLLGLQAAAWRVPFLPTRAGLGSDILRVNPDLQTITSPYPSPDGAEGETLVAMPALHLDAALVHVNRADARGNAITLGPDPYFDDLLLEAADAGFVSTEQVVGTADLATGPDGQAALRIKRMHVTGVVEAPGGAGFTSCVPDYDRDEAAQKAYAVTAKDPDAFRGWLADWMGEGR